MKSKFQYIRAIILLIAIMLQACSADKPLKENEFDSTDPFRSDLDFYIEDNYVNPYNIDVRYKWNQNLVDFNRYLFPPSAEKIIPALEVLKKIWIESYTSLGGTNFIKNYAPREVFLVGGKNFNTDGTTTLGLAEGGMRITLFSVDLVNVQDPDNVRAFVNVIQHEYIHILNQTKPFDQDAFAKITPSGYTANWATEATENSRDLGFITSYARSNVAEDFAEMGAVMLTHSEEEYNSILARITRNGRISIRKKEALIVTYFREAFDIDFYKLREETHKNTKSILRIK